MQDTGQSRPADDGDANRRTAAAGQPDLPGEPSPTGWPEATGSDAPQPVHSDPATAKHLASGSGWVESPTGNHRVLNSTSTLRLAETPGVPGQSGPDAPTSGPPASYGVDQPTIIAPARPSGALPGSGPAVPGVDPGDQWQPPSAQGWPGQVGPADRQWLGQLRDQEGTGPAPVEASQPAVAPDPPQPASDQTDQQWVGQETQWPAQENQWPAQTTPDPAPPAQQWPGQETQWPPLQQQQQWSGQTPQWPGQEQQWPAQEQQWPTQEQQWPAQEQQWPAPEQQQWPTQGQQWPAPEQQWPAQQQWPGQEQQWPGQPWPTPEQQQWPAQPAPAQPPPAQPAPAQPPPAQPAPGQVLPGQPAQSQPASDESGTTQPLTGPNQADQPQQWSGGPAPQAVWPERQPNADWPSQQPATDWPLPGGPPASAWNNEWPIPASADPLAQPMSAPPANQPVSGAANTPPSAAPELHRPADHYVYRPAPDATAPSQEPPGAEGPSQRPVPPFPHPGPDGGQHAAPDVPATPPTAEEFAARRAHRPRPPEPTMGMPALVRRLSFGMVSPALSRREIDYRDAVAKVRRNFGGLRQVTVVNPKGGAGKTVAVLMTAMTFGQNRGGYVLAWDNNETQGTLGMRSQQDYHVHTVRDVLRALPSFQSSHGKVGDLTPYVRSQGEAMFDVLASDESATAGEMLTAQAFVHIREVVSRFYKLIVVDTGNNVRAENWQAAIDATDQLVITMSARGDSAETAARMLDHLDQTGRHELVKRAVTVVAMAASRKDVDLPAIQRHFAARTRSVLLAPYERLLDSGEPIRYGELSQRNRNAWLRIAASIAEGL